MTESVVKHVRLFEVVELRSAPQPSAATKAIVGQQGEEVFNWYQSFYDLDAPSMSSLQSRLYFAEVSHFGRVHVWLELLEAAEVLRAGLALERLKLTLI